MTGRFCSRCGQLAGVGDLARMYRPYVRSFKGRHREGPAFQAHKLDLVRGSVSVDVHDRADVSGLKRFAGHVGTQHDAVMFLDHSRRILSRVSIRIPGWSALYPTDAGKR